jgi:hypothetical protein
MQCSVVVGYASEVYAASIFEVARMEKKGIDIVPNWRGAAGAASQ